MLRLILNKNFNSPFRILLIFCRLALKAFKDQKRRFFPHLGDESSGQATGGESGSSKKQCGPQGSVLGHTEELSELSEDKTLSDVLTRLEKQAPNVKIFTYQRLDWLKRASSLMNSSNDNPIELGKENNFQNSSRVRTRSLGAVAADQVAVIELFVPSVFRAIVSLHPAGSIDPDAVAFFSPDEVICNEFHLSLVNKSIFSKFLICMLLLEICR